MSLQKVPINNFRGGLNTRDGPFDLQPNESPDLLNVTVTNLVGQLETRKGKERYDVSGLPALPVDNAKQVVIGAAGKRFLMLSINGGVYACNPSGEIKKLHAGTAGTVWDFEVYSDVAFKDWVYMGNGTDAMQKWDGEAAATVTWTATKGAIPLGGVVCVWENRMFVTYVGANSQRLYFSEFGDPEATIAEYGFVDIRGSEEDLDSIQDLAVLGARLIVLKRRGVFFISSAVTMLNRHIGGPGAWGRFMTAELEEKLYFFNPQGIFATGGVEVVMESGSINNWFPQHLNREKYENARLVVTKDTYPRLLLAVSTGTSEENDKLIEMVPKINFRRIGGRRYLLLPAFMLHTIAATSLATWNPLGDQELLIASSRLLFSTLAVTDNFIRANENPLKGVWSKPVWAGSIGEVKADQWRGPAKTLIAAYDGGKSQKDVQVSYGSVPTLGAEEVGSQVELFARMQSPATERTGYVGRIQIVKREVIGIEVFITIQYSIERWEKGKVTTLTSFTVRTPGPSGSYGFSVIGNEMVLWQLVEAETWAAIISTIDSSITEPGNCGMGFEVAAPGFESHRITSVTIGEPSAGTVNRLYSIFTGEKDDESPIIAHWKSSWIAIQEQEPKERIRRLNVQLSGDAFVDVYKDFEELPTFSAQLPQEGQRKEYNEPSGEGLAYRFTRVRPETHGRYHQIQFRSDTEGKPFKVNTAELAIRGGKEH